MVRFVLAERLKSFRERAGFTIYEVGERIGKSGKTVSAWECGRGQPDADMLIALCSLYGINSIGDLYGEKFPAREHLNSDEEELLQNYRSLNDEGKKMLLMTSRGIVSGGQYQEVSKDSTG